MERGGVDVVLRRAAQHRTHSGDQLAQAVGLRDVVVGADLEADHGVDLGALCGDHDDRHRGARPDRAADVDPGQAGEHQVEEHQIGLDHVEEAQRLGPVAGDRHVEALAGQADDEGVDEGLVVLRQEHLGMRGVFGLRRRRAHVCFDHTQAAYSGGLGRTRVKVDPSPSRESTSTRPWWLLATWRTMERPSPVPPDSRLRP